MNRYLFALSRLVHPMHEVVSTLLYSPRWIILPRGLMEDIARTLGANLRKARCRQGLSQAQMAEHIDMPVELYARMERGALLPSMQMFVKLCHVLDARAGQLLGMSGPRLRSIRGNT